MVKSAQPAKEIVKNVSPTIHHCQLSTTATLMSY
jgi:hypothetical protein